jgi:hypothetical protein|tara:strand:+ start:266 stop:469 length:204 start_codon:yes stop_codon:yes gene_type:complete
MAKSEIYLAEAVFRVINERRNIVLNVLKHNSVKSMEHYKQMMGEMEALEYVENEIKDLLNRQEVNDE